MTVDQHQNIVSLAHIIELRNRWDVPGSRLFLRVSSGLALRRNSRGGLARAKAAPLQAVGANTPCRRAIAFEDEDDDEDEDEDDLLRRLF
jgi:hypothetical protein